MPLQKLGAPPYLLAEEVLQDEQLEIIREPWVTPKEKSKWGRERGKCTVKIVRTGEVRTWSLNNISWDKLVDSFGNEPGVWIGKKVVLRKEVRNINGVDKPVLFARAYVEPQQKLQPEQSSLEAQIAQLSPEQKQQLLDKVLHQETE